MFNEQSDVEQSKISDAHTIPSGVWEVSSYSLIQRMLLVLSGIETNPGPETV